MSWRGKKEGSVDLECQVVGQDGASLKKVSVEPGTTIADVRKALGIPGDYNAVRPKTNEPLADAFDAGALPTGERIEFSMASKLGYLAI